MVGSHARNVPLGMANQTRVDDKPENALQGHKEVKGQMSAFLPRTAMWASKSANVCNQMQFKLAFSIYQTSW